MNEHSIDKDDMLVKSLWSINHTMRRISEGKASQERILIILSQNRNMTQKALTDRLGIQPGSASEVLGKLESSGFILRTTNGTDRRTTDICLTESGELAAQAALIRREERHQQMFSCLEEEEKTALLALLTKINEDWKEKYKKG